MAPISAKTNLLNPVLPWKENFAMSRTASPLACGIAGSDGLRSATLLEQDRGALRPPALA
jgi:hypothetical protein